VRLGGMRVTGRAGPEDAAWLTRLVLDVNPACALYP
jgi:hypothetical protein